MCAMSLSAIPIYGKEVEVLATRTFSNHQATRPKQFSTKAAGGVYEVSYEEATTECGVFCWHVTRMRWQPASFYTTGFAFSNQKSRNTG
jgi:hypothetical protein